MISFWSIVVSGILASNCLVSTCSGIDITTNPIRDIKRASIYSLVVFSILFASSIITFICDKILAYFSLTRMLFLVTLVCVAGFVQMAEYLTKKFAPRFSQDISYFIPTLACNLFLLILPTSFAKLTFWQMLLSVIASGVGMWLILAIIAGIKHNYFKQESRTNTNIASLVVVFVLIVIWSVF